MQKVQYGIRLEDVRLDEEFVIEVPARSLDHAEEVVNWHNDPKHESCYKATVVTRLVITTNWETAAAARNVTA
jgi:hypothetical protein